MEKSINLIGAGLAGSLLAVSLAQKGYQVSVFERRPDMRQVNLSAGKSINLALSVRGMHAIEEVGLLDEVMEIAIPMYGRMMHSRDGELSYQPYSKDPKNCINSVSRGELNKKLMTLAGSYPGVSLHFNHRCTGMDFTTGTVSLLDDESGKELNARADATIGCDGAFSAIRYEMLKVPRFDFDQSYLKHGYKELTIPPGPDGSFLMEKNALHIWPRGQYMMIALPNLDGSFTCTLFFPFEGRNSFETLGSDEAVMAFFMEEFPDAVPLMPTLLQDFRENPTSALVTIRCFPWAMEDKSVLLGDAAHAIVPFFGQGMNAAFEDCSVLSACIDADAPDWRKVFRVFQESRKANSDAIADMAIENFIEMRDLVADTRFLLRKELEHKLEKEFPAYNSRYELVSFSRIPYAEAYLIGEKNNWILDALMENMETIEDLDMEMAAKVIAEFLG